MSVLTIIIIVLTIGILLLTSRQVFYFGGLFHVSGIISEPDSWRNLVPVRPGIAAGGT